MLEPDWINLDSEDYDLYFKLLMRWKTKGIKEMKNVNNINPTPEEMNDFHKKFSIDRQDNRKLELGNASLQLSGVKIKPVLVFYINVSGMPIEDIDLYMQEIKVIYEKDVELVSNYFLFWIPTRTKDTEIVLLNPNNQYITDDIKIQEELKKLNETFIDILNNKEK